MATNYIFTFASEKTLKHIYKVVKSYSQKYNYFICTCCVYVQEYMYTVGEFASKLCNVATSDNCVVTACLVFLVLYNNFGTQFINNLNTPNPKFNSLLHGKEL